MTYDGFRGWLDNNRPFDMPMDEFLEFCAVCGVLTIQHTVDSEGLTITQLINKFYDTGPMYQ